MFAVQAVCTIRGSSLFGHTVNLWTGRSRRLAQKWLPKLAAQYMSLYRDFQVVDLAAPGECAGTENPASKAVS